VKVWVCNHYISFEGEIGETRVFDSKEKADAWVAEFTNETQHEWREIEEHEVG
jgi:hypothetical protein